MTDSTDPTNTGSTDPRGRSTIQFPYDDIDAGLEIVTAVHEQFGGRATVEQVAAALKQKHTSGAFRVKLSAARLYTFITTDREAVRTTELGLRARTDEAARAEAFLNVELYRHLYDELRHSLPGDAGLEAAITAAGVTPKQVTTARQVFLRSAQQAGFFKHGKDKLVMPGPGAPADDKDKNREDNGDDDKKDLPGVMNHPLIQGLLAALPEPGSDFSDEDREVWLKTLDMNLSIIYKRRSNRRAVDEPMRVSST